MPSIDGVKKPAHNARPIARTNVSVGMVRPPVNPSLQKRPTTPPAKPSNRTASSRWQRMLLPALIVGLLVSGFALQFPLASEIIIGVYAVVAFMRHIESRITFTLALVSLACVILLLLSGHTRSLAESFAEYAFLLLIVGTVSLTIETLQMGSRSSM